MAQPRYNAALAARMIGDFRSYRVEEMQRELAGDFERRSVDGAQP